MRCFICLGWHDPDDACASERRPAPKTPDLFADAEDAPMLGPVFNAQFDGEDSCCGQGIEHGEAIRADGEGGWIHAGCEQI